MIADNVIATLEDDDFITHGPDVSDFTTEELERIVEEMRNYICVDVFAEAFTQALDAVGKSRAARWDGNSSHLETGTELQS